MFLPNEKMHFQNQLEQQQQPKAFYRGVARTHENI